MKQGQYKREKKQQPKKPLFNEDKFFQDEDLFKQEEVKENSKEFFFRGSGYLEGVNERKHNLWEDENQIDFWDERFSKVDKIEKQDSWWEDDCSPVEPCEEPCPQEPWWEDNCHHDESGNGLECWGEEESECEEPEPCEDLMTWEDNCPPVEPCDEPWPWNPDDCECHHPEPDCHHKKEDCKVIHEKPVYCKEEKNYYHKVKHIIPVVCKKVENHHYNHEYVIKKEVIKKEHRYDHGKRDEDWCKVACKDCKPNNCDCE